MPDLSPADLADALAAGIDAEEQRLRLEQAVHGLDALNEVALHAHLRTALEAAGYGVHAEQRYPRDRTIRRRSEGDRCDLVVTADRASLRQPDREPTLFDPSDAVDLEAAYWLEVKTANQFLPEGPNARYAAEFVRPPRGDVLKLARDPRIRQAGLLLVVFAADQAVAERDLRWWEEQALRRGLPIGAAYRRSIRLLDRIGNRACVLALHPVARAAAESPD
ncbi:MAG: hypothetical protein KDA22_13370 [Phycisphaerales bacterium]|nr:hypothetical protein [Phycisphaerales bacterium]